MRKKRWMALWLTLAAFGLFVAGCGDDDDDGGSANGSAQADSGDGDKPKVGLVLKTLANPVWQAVEKGAQTKADELGIELISEAGKTEADIQGQINIIEDLLTQGVDSIAIAANGTGQLRPALERAVDEGVQVVLIDTDVPDLDRVTLVVTDNRGMSERISKDFVEQLGGKAVAGVLTFPEVSPVELRVQGTKDAIQGTDVKIVSELAGDCLRNKAVDATTDMLQAHSDMTAIFGECGQNATGAVQAIKNAGKTPGKDVQVIGFDGVPQEIQLVESGELFATVWQDFQGIGAKAVEAAVESEDGKEFPPELYVDGEVVTKANVGDFQIDGEIVVRK